DENFAQLRLVAHYARLVRAELQFERDVHALRFGAALPARASYLAHVEHELVNGDGLEVVVSSLAREVLYALDGLRAVLRRLDDELQARLHLLRVFQREEQLRAAQYACERVVEVVRHARREFAERGELFDLRVLLAYALLLGDVVRKLFDVSACLLGLLGSGFGARLCGGLGFGGGGHRLDVFEVGAVGQVDDGDDRSGCDKRVEARGRGQLDDDACGGSAREVRYRSPEVLIAPGRPQRLVRLERRVDGGDCAVGDVLDEGHHAERGDEGRGEVAARQSVYATEEKPQDKNGDERRAGHHGRVEEAREDAERLLAEARGGEEFRRRKEHRHLAAVEQERQEDEGVGEGNLPRRARDGDAEARANQERDRDERHEPHVEP